MTDKKTIGIIGGTGDLGSGLAKRWHAAGHRIVLGSRSAEKANDSARDMFPDVSDGSVTGLSNLGAAQAADVVVIAVPWSNHEATLVELREALLGKIVIDAVVPLVPPKVATVQLPPQGSAALAAREVLGDGVRLTAAFHNVAAAKLHGGGPIDCDVLVFADDRATRDEAIALTDAAGLRGIDGGMLANAAAAEALTSVLIAINRRYKSGGAGIRITGLPADGAA